MAIDPLQSPVYNDVGALTELRRSAQAHDPKALRETARQFESLFTRMMLESMRKASPGDSLFDSGESGFYRDMFDDQLSVELSKGRGLGLAEMLVRQLQGIGATTAAAGVAAPGSAAGSADAAVPTAAAGTTASDGIAAGGDRDPAGVARQERFVQRMLPLAQDAARQLGVAPETIVAHAALETGWGRSMPTSTDGTPSFNLFGVKAAADGPAVASRTLEFEQGSAVTRVERFRAYATPQDGIQDYVNLLAGSARYAGALGQGGDAAAFARALQQGGYATDPRYADKLTAVAARVSALIDAGLKGGNPRPIEGVQATG